MEHDKIISKIKELCSAVTESTYDQTILQGYNLLLTLHAMGVNQEQVYQSLLEYYNNLEDSMIRDCAGDILDFAAGWCSPQWFIW